MTTKYFLGSNTTNGFVGKFEDLLQTSSAVILKGGAGCGKSTLMRKVGKEALRRNFDVEYFYCSGDVDSLDGVRIPSLNFAVLDGTEPHALEPAVPLIKHRVVNLLDKAKYRNTSDSATIIQNLIISKKTHFNNAYQYLKGLNCIIDKIASDISASSNVIQVSAVSEQIIDLIKAERSIENRQLFMSAITADGVVCFARESLSERTNIVVDCDDYTFVHLLLPAIEKHLRYNDIPYERYLSPFSPKLSEAIGIGNLSVSNYRDIKAKTHFSLPHATLSETDLSIFNSLLNASVDALAKAKSAHLEIEKQYSGAADWEDVNQKTAAICDCIFENC